MVCLVHVTRLQGSPDEKVIGVCVAPEGSNVKANVVVATSTSVSAWTQKGEATFVRRKLGVVDNSIKGVAVTKEGYVIGSLSDGCSRAWGIESGSSKVSRMPGDGGKSGGRCLGLTHDGLVIGGGEDGSLTIRTQQGKLVKGGTINAHKDAIVSVHGSPCADKPYFATASLDGTVKIFTMVGMKRLQTLKPSTTSKATSVILSPDSSLCAIGYKDGKCALYDASTGFLWEYDMGKPISQICFSPNRYWMCAATSEGFKIVDLENKVMINEDSFYQDHTDAGGEWGDVAHEEERRLQEDAASSKSPGLKPCTSLCWSNDGEMLYVGYENGDVHVYKVRV